jgi:hypothetical protein
MLDRRHGRLGQIRPCSRISPIFEHYVPIEAIAEWNKAGMWAGDFVAPWKWRRKKKRKEFLDRIERGLEQDKRNKI